MARQSSEDFGVLTAQSTSSHQQRRSQPGFILTRASIGNDWNLNTNDLYNAIRAGDDPKWDLYIRVLEPQDLAKFDFDALDDTKTWTGVPERKIGTLTLNRVPDNYFESTEESAFALSAGLLLLRLCDGLLLLVHSAILSGFKMSLEGLVQLVAASVGSLILVGLATPIAAAVGGVTILCIAAPIETHIVLATIGASLALLGPGAWSIDARLYGRRRIDLDSL
jgi:hypothetical protein